MAHNSRRAVVSDNSTRPRLEEGSDARGHGVVVVDDADNLPFVERQARVGNAKADHVADLEG